MIRDRRGGVGFVVFILLLVCFIAVVLVVIYVKGNEEPVKPGVLNLSENVSFLNVSISSNALSKVSFVLRNQSFVFENGNLFPQSLEFYRGGVPNQSLVWLSAWSSDYYWNETVCNVSVNNFPCRVGLKRKALGYQVFFNGTVVVVDTNESGVFLQAPILFCWTERANVQNVLMDLPSAPVPTDLKKSVDFCYSYDKDIMGVKYFPVIVHKNPFLNVSDVLVVTLRDYEISQQKNVGDRQAGVIV